MAMNAPEQTFVQDQRDLQIRFREESDTFTSEGKQAGKIGRKTYPFAIPQGLWAENLCPSIREDAARYFTDRRIAWHRMRNHLLSSQICCLNFLMPFATRPGALAALLRPTFGDIEMLPVEDERYVAFEWIGASDYLNEGRGPNRTRTRGANCTSSDAALKFRDANGVVTLALIEWKFTEAYGSPPDPNRKEERLRRYREIAFDPEGPLRPSPDFELSDLFYEPFYQFLRQQMLAFRVRQAGEGGCNHGLLLHIAPKANVGFQRITAPKFASFNGSAVTLWRSLLTRPDDFRSVTTGDLFGAFDVSRCPDLQGWHDYIRERYGSLLV